MQFFRWLIASAVLCFTTAAHAQDVLYSEYDKFDYRGDEYAVVGMVGDRMYTYLSQGGNAMLNAYDDSMNKIATVLLDFFPSRIYDLKFVASSDRIIILYQALESNKVIQYAALLDDKGRLKGKPVELGNAKTSIFGATRTYFQSAISDDKKSILIYSVHDNNEEVELDAKWLDEKLTIVKRSKAIFKTDNRLTHGEVNIGNDGAVYMAAYTLTGTQNYADQYWMLVLKPGSTKFEPKEMALDNRYAAGGYMKVDNVNGKVYFGGFYAGRKNGSFDGVIYAVYNIADSTFGKLKLLPFEDALINSPRSKRNKKPFDNYQVRQLIVKNDGGFVLVAEEQYITTHSNYTPGFGYYSSYSPYMSSVVHEYHFDDIMALSYNADGALHWHAYIPKHQYSQEDNGAFSSYVLLNTGGTLAFIYNDFDPRHSRIQLSTLTSEGKSESHSFTPEGNDYPDWLPKSGKQVAARELVIPCFYRKQICFARVIF